MEELHAVIHGNKLEARFACDIDSAGLRNSKKYTISSCSVFCVEVRSYPSCSDSKQNRRYYVDTAKYTNLIFVSFINLNLEDKLNYAIKFTSNDLNIANKCFTTDDGTWHLINESNNAQQLTFDVTVTLDNTPRVIITTFATLHDDTELTDFELRGEDGSVHIHRAALAASSPVLRGMLGGTWRETTEGHVDVPGTSKTTLQYLKDYVYLGTVPETGLEQLLLLASFYMMPNLEKNCIIKLVSSLTAQNTYDLLKFAVKNEMTKLTLAILERVQLRAVKVKDMKVFLQEE